MATLLILSVGTLVGSNLLEAAEQFRPGLRVVGVNSLAEAPNNFRCDQVYLAPPAREAEAYWRCVATVLEREEPDLVLAGRDEDITLMAGWRERHARWAGRFAVGAAALSSLMTDKLAAHDWSLARGLPFAPTVGATDPQARERCTAWMAETGAALVAKPRSGSGSRGVRLLLNQAQLSAALDEEGLVIQPCLIDATPYRRLDAGVARGLPLFWAPALLQCEAQVVIGRDGSILGRFDMQTSMAAGRCEYARAYDDAGFRRVGNRYAEALAEAGWRGPASVQLIHHPRLGYQAIEFNAPSGGMMPRLLLGFDELGLLLSAWTGRDYPRPPRPVAERALRVSCDVGTDPTAAGRLQQAGAWPSC